LNYRPDGSAMTPRKGAYRWKDENTMEWWNDDTPQKRTVDVYRTNKDFIENRVVKHQQGDGEWEPFLKIGAKPGDTWDRHYKAKGYAESISFQYEKFTTHQGRPCVVLAYEMKGGTTTLKGRRWYLKGIGMVRDELKINRNGSWCPSQDIIYPEWGDYCGDSAGANSNPSRVRDAGPNADLDDTEGAGKKHGASEASSEYEFGYQKGLEEGRRCVRLYQGMNASGKAQFRRTYLDILGRFERDYRSVAKAYGENHPATQQKKGFTDGYRKALADGGIQ
jgi:hypothetical protein